MDLSGDGGSEGGASGGFHSEHSGDSVPGLSDRDDSDDGEGQHDHDDDDDSDDDGARPAHSCARLEAAELTLKKGVRRMSPCSQLEMQAITPVELTM